MSIMFKKRNLLCICQKDKLELGHRLLYEPYKNILRNFIDLATKIEAKDFDPVAKVYDGLFSAPIEIKEYYEALLGVTSYYQHSQGGRGKYLEKKIASAVNTCSLDIALSELPIWLSYPELHKKRGIFTLKGLSSQEKRMLRTTPWDWLGDKDENSDVGNILRDEKTMVLLEVKNRVDSGGTSARREIWTSQKFGIIVDYLLRNGKLYQKDNVQYSLSELLGLFGLKVLELYVGILFDKSDKPATLENDIRNGFYSSNKEGFRFLRTKIKESNKTRIKNEDSENLQMEVLFQNSDFRLKIGALYGDNITLKLFRQKFPVSDLLLLRYDDMWLSQLTAISERMFLLKHSKNYMTIFKNLLKRDKNLRIDYNELIDSECEETKLRGIIAYLFDKYLTLFSSEFVPEKKDREQYLADIIQLLCASDA